MHGQESEQNADRQGHDRDQRAADVQQEDDADEGDDETLLDQRVPEIGNGTQDQGRAIIDRLDGDARRQAGQQFGDPLPDAPDRRQGIPLRRA